MLIKIKDKIVPHETHFMTEKFPFPPPKYWTVILILYTYTVHVRTRYIHDVVL
jgi:hypothetical protein